MLLTSGNPMAQQMTRTANSHLCQHSVFISNVLFILFLFFLVYSSAQGISSPYLFCYNLENNLRPCFFIKYPRKSILYPPKILHLCLLVLRLGMEWIKKIWYRYTMNYNSSIKRNKIGSFVEMRIILESVVWSEVSQKEKNGHCLLTYIYVESRKVV